MVYLIRRTFKRKVLSISTAETESSTGYFQEKKARKLPAYIPEILFKRA